MEEKGEVSRADLIGARYEIHCWTRNRKRHPSLAGNIIIILLVICCVVIAAVFTTKDTSLVGRVIEILTLLVMAFTARQVIIMRESTAMQMSQAVYEDTLEVLEKKEMGECYEAIDPLKSRLSALSKEALIKDSDYQKINKVVYHYEYLGQLVRYNKVDFGLLFDTVTFPDALWKKINEGGNGSLLLNLRKHWYDKWDGFEYLHVSYELLRSYDKLNRSIIKEEDYKNAVLEWAKVKKRLNGRNNNACKGN